MTSYALTFDTQAVEWNSFNFEGGLLAKLERFKESPVRVVVSEVVVREIERHLIEKTREARKRIEEAHKAGALFGIATGARSSSHDLDPDRIAKARLEKFLKAIGAEVIPCDDVSNRTLLDLYFNKHPPFSVTKDKEFPDALALLSLESWARTSGVSLVAVSGDKDWKAFCEPHPHMEWVEKLPEAIESLLGDIDAAIELGGALLDTVANDPGSEVGRLFRLGLSDELASRRFQFEAESEYDSLRQETAEAFLSKYSLPIEGGTSFRVVSPDPTSLAIEFPLTIGATAHATFELDARTLPLGTAEVIKEFDLTTSVLVTFDGDLKAGRVSSVNVAILKPSPIHVDLGNVDNETYEEFERYD